jgi:GntR family transcriptional regulator, transcriptional repressor for pyruvate dehydrogenase complex
MLELVRPKKLSDQIYESILKQVMSGEYPEGTRLPAEKDLASLFDVSRPVVREALSRLRSDGIVVSRHGSGTYVQHRPNKALFDVAPVGSIAGLMRTFEFRLALECEAAALAALRRTTQDLTLIGRAYDKLEKLIKKGELGVEADIDFHLAIAVAAKNDLFYSAMEVLLPQVSKGITTARRLSLNVSGDRLRRVQHEHKQIMVHIREGNPEGARDAMQMHLRNAKTRVLTESGEH